jgi:chorismate mutase/prephenate dehydratase
MKPDSLPAMPCEESELSAVRQEIDRLDQAILALISERAACASKVAEIKHRYADSAAPVIFYRPEREAQVLRAIAEKNPGPLSDESVKRLFREIMSACLAFEQAQKVAYLGPKGTYSHDAAIRQFGHQADFVPCMTIDAVFNEVESGQVNYGIVPVENSTEGAVHRTFDLLQTSNLCIIGEVELAIHHNLLSCAAQLNDIQSVYAHEQALAQCRLWLSEHLPQAELISMSSNAQAVKKALKHPQSAAIASLSASELYAIPVLAKHISDLANNTTRFIVIARQQAEPSGDDKTSLLISTQNRSGVLYEVLGAFAKRAISLTRIVSRPSRMANWEYVFFVDVQGHAKQAPLAQALNDLETIGANVKVLGAYPVSPLNP